MSDLQRVLAALDAGTATIRYGDAMADAARVIRELEKALRGIAEDSGCAYPVTVTKKNPRSVQYKFGVADGHRVAAAKACVALAWLTATEAALAKAKEQQ